jgi:hypothetical protein
MKTTDKNLKGAQRVILALLASLASPDNAKKVPVVKVNREKSIPVKIEGRGGG